MKPIRSILPLLAVLPFSMAQGAMAADPGADALKNQVKAQASGLADRKAEGWLKNLLSSDRGVTEVSVEGIAHNKPVWNILLLRPLTESADFQQNTFFQGSLFRQDDRTTLNLGYGYRQLTNDNKVLFGVNAFYDYEMPYDHQRMSLGGEIRSSVGEINANIYRGLSGWRKGANSLEEKALSGHDIEAALALPYLPMAHVRAKNFVWNGIDGAADRKGNTYSLTGTLPMGFSVEAGHTDYTGATRDESFFKVTYTLPLGDEIKNVKPLKLNVPYSMDSMVDRRFEKVRRDNRIVKATRTTGFAVTVSGY